MFFLVNKICCLYVLTVSAFVFYLHFYLQSPNFFKSGADNLNTLCPCEFLLHYIHTTLPPPLSVIE